MAKKDLGKILTVLTDFDNENLIEEIVSQCLCYIKKSVSKILPGRVIVEIFCFYSR